MRAKARRSLISLLFQVFFLNPSILVKYRNLTFRNASVIAKFPVNMKFFLEFLVDNLSR